MRRHTVASFLLVLLAGSGAAYAQEQQPLLPSQAADTPPPIWRWGYPHQAGFPPYGFRVFTDWQPSNMRLDVSPNDARVFVDTHYAGTVNDFNSRFERLKLHAGPHLIEIRKRGFKSLGLEFSLYPGQNVTYSQTMQPSRDDEDLTELETIAPALEEGAFLPAVDRPSADLRLDVTPKNAAIYSDGFYVGTVDDFNGSQHLMLMQGRHHVVLMRDGYEPLDLNLSLDSGKTVTYRAAMKKAADVHLIASVRR